MDRGDYKVPQTSYCAEQKGSWAECVADLHNASLKSNPPLSISL